MDDLASFLKKLPLLRTYKELLAKKSQYYSQKLVEYKNVLNQEYQLERVRTFNRLENEVLETLRAANLENINNLRRRIVIGKDLVKKLLKYLPHEFTL